MTAASIARERSHEPLTTPLSALLCVIRGEFREMPGMRLTLEQAMRLWSLNRETCASVLDELMASRFIERDLNGRYKRAHGSY